MSSKKTNLAYATIKGHAKNVVLGLHNTNFRGGEIGTFDGRAVGNPAGYQNSISTVQVVGTCRTRTAIVIDWVLRTVFLFNIPSWVAAEIPKPPGYSLNENLQLDWKTLRRNYIILFQNSNLFATVMSG